MGSTTTAFPTSFKQQLAQGMHCFTATLTPTGNVAASTTVSSVSSIANICRGMPISGTNIPASTFVADIPSASSLTLSQAGTGTSTGATLTINGDTFNIALIKYTPTGTYGAASTGYANITSNSDEASGTGYTAGGQVMSANVTPATSGTTAYWSWSTNPSWTGATLNVQGCMIYNASNRGGYQANNAVYVGDFGGQQQVTSGTLTLSLPPNTSTGAVLRIQ